MIEIKKESILSKIKSHANIVIGNFDIYEKLKTELLENKKTFLTFDYSDDKNKKEKSLVLEDLEKMRDFIKTKSDNVRYIISNRNMRKTELQNAMLKMLEEADASICFVFVLDTTNYFLPTVLSRTQIINMMSNKNVFTEYKRKMIIEKRFKDLEKILQAEDMYSRTLISEKQAQDFLTSL
jgi:DNA polymerase III delta prime subunit